MAITEAEAPVESPLWPQGDARDPLGVWGFRHGVTGDASGGSIKVITRVVAGKRSAYVYTAYAAQVAQLTGASAATIAKLRLLTNWPNVDPAPGVQAFSTLMVGRIVGGGNLTAPHTGPGADATIPGSTPWIGGNERFILLFDPRQPAGLGALDILEFEIETNTNLATYSFEAYGYFWDRSVMQAPGGPRHPGGN